MSDDAKRKLLDAADREVMELESRIAKMTELRAVIEQRHFPEVVINKNNHEIYLPIYALDMYTPKVTIRLDAGIPGLNHSGISFEEFVQDYIPYSPKTRKLLPKR